MLFKPSYGLHEMQALIIAGFWNSGTTLLTSILKTHPSFKLRRAWDKPNLEERKTKRILWKLGYHYHQFGDYSKVIENGFQDYPDFDLSATEVEFYREKFFRYFKVNPQRASLLLKNPYLFYHRQTLNKLFPYPGFKYLVVIRRGESQATSKDYWLKSKNPEQQLKARAIFWKKSMDLFFKTWHKDPKCMVIRYENLCTHPSETLQSITDFFNIDFKPLKSAIPEAFEVRMKKFEKLNDKLKLELNLELSEMNKKIEEEYPLH